MNVFIYMSLSCTVAPLYVFLCCTWRCLSTKPVPHLYMTVYKGFCAAPGRVYEPTLYLEVWSTRDFFQ